MRLVLLRPSSTTPEVAIPASPHAGEDKEDEDEPSVELDDVHGLFGEALRQGDQEEQANFEHNNIDRELDGSWISDG